MSLFLYSCGFVLVILALLGAWREYLNSLIKKSEHIMNAKLAEIEADRQKFMMEMQAARGALEVHREVQSETKH